MPLPWECPGPGHHSTGPFTDAVRILQASGRVMAPALEKLTAQAKPDRGEYKQGDSHQAPGHSQGREDDLQLSPCTVLCEQMLQPETLQSCAGTGCPREANRPLFFFSICSGSQRPEATAHPPSFLPLCHQPGRVLLPQARQRTDLWTKRLWLAGQASGTNPGAQWSEPIGDSVRELV